MAEPLYCVCRQPYDSLQFMIQCDSCEEWFHGSCIGIEEHQASDIERYHCPECAILHGPLTLKKRRNWHRHDYSEIDDGSKAVQAGTVAFIKELKSRRFKESNIVVKLDNGRHLTVEYLEKQGFNRPILVLNREGLGMVIPDKSFNVLDVERHVGSMRELDVIDVCRQEDYHMRMREWTDYYMNPIKKKILNVISLEFSNTSMSQLIHAPMVVREMDWAGHVWPSDLPEDSPHKKPLIQKYCLMGVKNSYTDFHVDFGGTSVWYHVLKGEKVFFFVEPSAENLTKYEKWVQSAHQSEMFFGDMVDHCFKCSVKPGQTLFIPSGWIHAVFTTVDSLVFGGNFLCTVNTELQLKVYGLERRLKTPDKFLHPCYETINWYAAVYLLDKIKAILEANNKPPDKLVQGMTALAAELKMWSTKGEEFTKQHKFFIPDSVSPAKLIKSIYKELKKTEKSSKNSRPSTPKLDENEVKESSPVPPVFIDGTRPRLKIKTPKPEAPKNQRSKNTGDQLKNELEDKSVIRTVNAHLKEDLKRKSDTLSTSLPSLKLKIPRTQEPGTTDVEVHEGRTQLSASAGSSSLKLLVSNGKIISNNNRSGRKITGKKFQPLLEQDGLGPSAVRDGSYSCSPSKQGPLRLKLSMNSMGNKSVSSLETHFTDSDTSDNELNFSVRGTPSLVPMQPRTTQGTMGTTRGLQATGSAPRPQQPVAGVDWASSTDQREEIEAANTLLFGLAAGGKVKKLRSFGYPAAAPPREPSSAQPSQPPIDPSASHLNSNPSASESESDGEGSGEEDLGFGASDYFHDNKYVYPPLAEMDDDKVSSWKPGQRKKKSERVDSTWNPKSKLTYSPSKEIRPVRQNSRRNTAVQPSGPGSLLNSPLEESAAVPGVFTFDGTSQETARESSKAGNNAVALNGSDASGVSESMSSDSKTDSNVKGQSKRGRHKTVTTTKQRLAKILKLDKTGRYMR